MTMFIDKLTTHEIEKVKEKIKTTDTPEGFIDIIINTHDNIFIVCDNFSNNQIQVEDWFKNIAANTQNENYNNIKIFQLNKNLQIISSISKNNLLNKVCFNVSYEAGNIDVNKNITINEKDLELIYDKAKNKNNKNEVLLSKVTEYQQDFELHKALELFIYILEKEPENTVIQTEYARHLLYTCSKAADFGELKEISNELLDFVYNHAYEIVSKINAGENLSVESLALQASFELDKDNFDNFHEIYKTIFDIEPRNVEVKAEYVESLLHNNPIVREEVKFNSSEWINAGSKLHSNIMPVLKDAIDIIHENFDDFFDKKDIQDELPNINELKEILQNLKETSDNEGDITRLELLIDFYLRLLNNYFTYYFIIGNNRQQNYFKNLGGFEYDTEEEEEEAEVNLEGLALEEVPTALGFIETEEMINLKNIIIRQIRDNDDNFRDNAAAYHKLAEDIVSKNRSEKESLSIFGLTITVATIWKEAGEYDIFVEEMRTVVLDVEGLKLPKLANALNAFLDKDNQIKEIKE